MDRKFFVNIIVIILLISIIPIAAIDTDGHHSDDDHDSTGDSGMIDSISANNSKHYLYDYSYHDVKAASSLGYWGSYWSEEYESWKYGCKIVGGFNATGSYGFPSHGMIQAAAFDISIASNKDNAYLSAINDDDFIWSTAQSSERNHISAISTTLIGLVLGYFSNAGVSLVWSTVEAIIDAMSNGYDRVNISSKSLWYLWEWIPQINEADQTMSFSAFVRSNQTATFKAEYHVFGQGFEVMSVGPMNITLSGVKTTNASSPSNMTPLERAEAGIVTVSKYDLENYMIDNNYSGLDIENALNENNEEYYFIADPEQYIIIGNCTTNGIVNNNHKMIYDYISEMIENADIGSTPMMLDYYMLDQSDVPIVSFSCSDIMAVVGNKDSSSIVIATDR